MLEMRIVKALDDTPAEIDGQVFAPGVNGDLDVVVVEPLADEELQPEQVDLTVDGGLADE